MTRYFQIPHETLTIALNFTAKPPVKFVGNELKNFFLLFFSLNANQNMDIFTFAHKTLLENILDEINTEEHEVLCSQ